MLNEESVYVEVTKIEIPNTIAKIGSYQFFSFYSLTNIIISGNVECIRDYAFRNCRKLK